MRYAIATLALSGAILLPASFYAQADTSWSAMDDLISLSDDMPEPVTIEAYEALNGVLGGDSVRQCNGYACSGWVEDAYADGAIKHRGYYKEGQLVAYKNFHSNGQLEREFKVVDNLRSQLRTYHESGTLHTETMYVRGVALEFALYYPNGQVRYKEEKHPKEPYYLVMDLFAADGKPLSELHLVDKKRVLFEQAEYWAGGVLRYKGRSQFNPQRYDTQRIGTWIRYDRNGKAFAEDHYVDGKLHETTALADNAAPRP